MVQFPKARSGDIGPPGFDVVETAVAPADPAFLIAAPRIGAEEHAVGPERRGKLPEHPGELAARHVEQRGIRKDPVEAGRRQVEGEEVLVQHFAIRRGARHGNERGRAVEADRLVTECGEPAQVPARPAPQIENGMGRLALYRIEQGRDVLADVVIGGAATIGSRDAIVFRDRDGSGLMRFHLILVPARLARRPGAPAGIREDHGGLDLAFRNSPVAPQQP